MLRDDLAAARAVLKKHSMMLLTASKAYVRHPELSAAKANRDYVLRQVGGSIYVIIFLDIDVILYKVTYLVQVCEAVSTISDVAQGEAKIFV